MTLDLVMSADNVYGIVINGGCYIWDFAAALLIIKESGGDLVDWEGNSIQLNLDNPKANYFIVAGEKTKLSQIIEIIKST